MDADSTPLVLEGAAADATDTADAGGKNKPTLLMMVTNGLCNIRYKSLLFLFILFILITSDVFINLLLKKINGAVDDRGYASPYGTVIQGLTLVLCYMLLSFLIDQGVI